MKTKNFIFLLMFLFTGTMSFALSSSQVSIQRVTSPTFTLDSNKPSTDGPRAAYVGIEVTNTSGGVLNDVWIKATSLVGTGFTLEGPSDSSVFIGRLDNNETRTAYFYISYPSTFNTALQLNYEVSDDQSGVVTGSTTITTTSKISASAGGQIDRTSVGNSGVIGGLVTDTVFYSFGNIKSGDNVEFQPNGIPNADVDSLVLIGVEIIETFNANVIPLAQNELFFIAGAQQGGTNNKLTAVFYYINKQQSGFTTGLPYASNTSGNQDKYTNDYSTQTPDTFFAPNNPSCLPITRSANTSVASPGDTITWTVTINNTTNEIITIDEITDNLAPGYAFIDFAPNSDVDENIAADVPNVDDEGVLNFIGGAPTNTFPFLSFTIQAGDSLQLIYRTTVPTTTSQTIHQSTSTYSIGAFTCQSNTTLTCVGCGAVPVTMISLSAEYDGSHVTLGWSTASEIDNEGFNIYAMSNEGDFKWLGFVPGHGNSQQIHHYTYKDFSPVEPMIYKLVQRDYNGKEESFILYATDVRNDGLTNNQPTAYPNPFEDRLFLKVNPEEESITYRIYDIWGRNMGEYTSTLSNGLTEITLPDHLSSGKYYLETITSVGVQHIMVIKR